MNKQPQPAEGFKVFDLQHTGSVGDDRRSSESDEVDESVRALLRAVETPSSDHEAIQAAALALGRRGESVGAEGLRVLLHLASSEDQENRHAAYRALAEYHCAVRHTPSDWLAQLPDAMLPELVQLLGDKDWRLATFAREALCAKGLPAIEATLPVLFSGEREARAQVAEVVWTLRDALAEASAETIGAVAGALDDDDWRVNETITRALEGIANRLPDWLLSSLTRALSDGVGQADRNASAAF